MVRIEPSRTKVALKIAASKVLFSGPTREFICASLLMPPTVLVPVDQLWFDWPLELVKSVTRPLDRMTPVSAGATPRATVEPFE